MRLVLAPGASGSATSLRPHVEGLRARGIEATAIDVPKGKAERAVSAYRERAGEGPGLVIGGHSYGGRVASLLAAEPDLELAGLVLLSYPLHQPGRPDRLRTEHFPALDVACLFVAGTRDPFGPPAEMEAATATIPGPVTHAWVEGGGHDVSGADDEICAAVTAWLADLGAAGNPCR